MSLLRATLIWVFWALPAAAQSPPALTLAWDARCAGTWTGTLGAAQGLPTEVTLTLWRPADLGSSCGTFEEEFTDGNVAMPCHMRLVRCIGDSTLVTRGQTKTGFDCGLPELEFSCSTGALVFRRPNTTDPDTTAALVRKPEPNSAPRAESPAGSVAAPAPIEAASREPSP